MKSFGCAVDWNGDTKEITATKDSRIIKMQIDKKEVSFTIDGKKESKNLDQPPIIKDNRTLVPLRFISEALDMQVGWDSQNSTAIIINYDEFAKLLKDNSAYFNSFNFTNSITLTKNYFDDADNNRNCTTKISIEHHDIEDSAAPYTEVVAKITGSSDFAKEVEKEEWNEFRYKKYEDDFYETSNYVISKMLCISKNSKEKIIYKRFNVSDIETKNIADFIKEISSVDDSGLNVNTFKELRDDWTKFASIFLTNGSRKLKTDDFVYNYLDLDKLFYQRTNSLSITTLQLLNRLLFKVSNEYNELFAEYPDVEYTFSNSGSEATIKFYIKNEYKEREEYILYFSIENMS